MRNTTSHYWSLTVICLFCSFLTLACEGKSAEFLKLDYQSVPMSISPDFAQVEFGGLPINLLLSNSNNAAITWEVSTAFGTLISNGFAATYTPPSFIDTPQVVEISAKSNGVLLATARIQVSLPDNRTLKCAHIEPSLLQGIVGYFDRASYAPGEALDVKVSLPSAQEYTAAIYKDSATPELVWLKRGIQGQLQTLPELPYRQSLNWPTSFSVQLPDSLTGGMYRLELIQKNATCHKRAFVVKKSPTAPPAPIVLLANEFTWHAYNDWGGASLYSCFSKSCGNQNFSTLLTSHRPSRGYNLENLSAGVREIAKWLEAEGYKFDMLSDGDLHSNPSALQEYSILVLPRHSEYWTTPMRDQLDRFLGVGKSLISLGGNPIYWKTVIQGDLIEVMKRIDERKHTLGKELGGMWRGQGIDRPEAALLGNRYTSSGLGVPLAPYKVINSKHWVLQGTQLQNDQSFGNGCSGWETDKIDPAFSPRSVELIAQGLNIDTSRPGQAGADMVYYRHAAGGQVFAVGSLAFFGKECQADPVVRKLLRNVFDRFLLEAR